MVFASLCRRGVVEAALKEASSLGQFLFDAVLFGKLMGLIWRGNWFWVNRGVHRQRVRGPDLRSRMRCCGRLMVGCIDVTASRATNSTSGIGPERDGALVDRRLGSIAVIVLRAAMWSRAAATRLGQAALSQRGCCPAT
jgi:hypothetical protein